MTECLERKKPGIEVELLVPEEEVKDNLERMGLVNRITKKMYPSFYLIKMDDKYFICHFKDLLKVPGATAEDCIRRNTAIWLLQKWGLINLVNGDNVGNMEISKKKLFILSREQLKNEGWELIHKFHYHRDKNTKNIEQKEI